MPLCALTYALRKLAISLRHHNVTLLHTRAHARAHTHCSVHASWNAYFKNVDAGVPSGAAFVPAPGLQTAYTLPAAATSASGSASAADVRDRLSLAHLIRGYQVRGHEVAVLDPLRLRNRPLSSCPELDYRTYGFTEADLDRRFDMSGVDALSGFLGSSELDFKSGLTLRTLLEKLQTTYCSTVGWEYMHIIEREKCNWIRERVEKFKAMPYSKDRKMQIFNRLTHADYFERFLAQKFNTAKRFGTCTRPCTPVCRRALAPATAAELKTAAPLV